MWQWIRDGEISEHARPTNADKRKTFRKLHEAGCFVIPNPWNVGTARYLQGLGFKALATTSSGHAHAQSFPDGGQTRDEVLAHFSEMAAATDVPLNADFENGFADDPDRVAENVTRCIATGVAGLSIEDSPKDATPLYDLELRWRASKPRAPLSTVPAARWSSRRGRKTSSAACPISTMPSAGSKPTRRPAPIASMRRASRPASRSRPSSRRWRRSR